MMKGLTEHEANEALKAHGYNELPSSKSRNIWQIALEVVKEPMFILLILCGTLYMFLGDYKQGAMLLLTIFVIIFITFYQHRKTENSLEALKRLSSPRALVIRDGKPLRIAGREVVPGDVLLLNEGDRISADAVIIDSINLTIDESLLTGESIVVSKSKQLNSSDSHGRVFAGTLVVQGKGTVAVVATGVKTEFGKIGASLQKIEQGETRLQKEMKLLIRNLLIIGAVISVGIVVAFYYTRGDFVQSLLNGLAATIAILPEEFPVVLTVFLALGAWRLSKKNVLTRKSSAIETLGSATVLCSDKTGTITQNKMEIATLYNGVEMIEPDFSTNKQLISDLIKTAYYASQKDSVDPMEKAISSTYERLFLQEESHKLIKEYPLSRELLAMTRVLEASDHARTVSAKGAPEAIFKLCKLTEQDTAKYLKVVQAMAEKGYRVIGVAHGKSAPQSLPESQHALDFIFTGLIGLEDPIRPEVPKAIEECKEAGIKVIMITGDFPATARSIAMQIGLDQKKGLVTGEELNSLSDEALKIRINDINIFARVAPEQKLRIVRALKANNEIVAMTGDGVNDAPALKAADIGISMGNKGTDVAREASSLVLLDDNFSSIVVAIRSGRRIFDNLQKAMSYIVAIHIPIIGLTLLPAFITTFPLLLMPLHIVFMELIIDPVCSIAFESEQEERAIMKRAPRNPDEQFFGSRKILSSIMDGILLLVMVIVVYFVSVREGHSGGEVRAIAFSSLIIGNIFLILTSLSNTRSFISVFVERNTAAISILVVALSMLIAIISIPALQVVFSFGFPGYRHFISSISGGICVLIILEAIKIFNRRGKA